MAYEVDTWTGTKLNTTVAEMPTEEFDRVYNINGRGTFFCTSAIAKVMMAQDEEFIEGRTGRRNIGHGSIVNISSLNGMAPVPYYVQYGSSKYAAIGVSLTAAAELASHGVRLNVVLPSWTNTPMFQSAAARMPMVAGILEKLSPLGRATHPEEVVEAIHFLCSPGARYMTGTNVVIDAGLSVTRGFR